MPQFAASGLEHCIASRKISEYFGEQLGTPAVMNIWIPDGYKDQPADRYLPRERLMKALDRDHVRRDWEPS